MIQPGVKLGRQLLEDFVIALTDVPEVPQRRLVDAFDIVGPAVVELVRGVTDPGQPVVGLDWTVSQLGAHLVAGMECYAEIVRGKGSPYTSLNTAEIAAVSLSEIDGPLQRGADLADQLEDALVEWRKLIGAENLPATVPWHEGIPMAPLRAAAILLADHVVHGYDLATTLRWPWRIDPEHVDLAVRGMCAGLPHVVDRDRARGFSATYQLRLRGKGTYTLRFDDGDLTVGGSYDGRVDCRISADPATYLLMACGRLGPVRPALTGRMVVYGRKPWLGPRLDKLLAVP
jgi:uncharacterized protein (TIGR03083 family)